MKRGAFSIIQIHTYCKINDEKVDMVYHVHLFIIYAFLNAYTIIDIDLSSPFPMSHAYSVVPVRRSGMFMRVYLNESAPGVSVLSPINPVSQKVVFDESFKSAIQPLVEYVYLLSAEAPLGWVLVLII